MDRKSVRLVGWALFSEALIVCCAIFLSLGYEAFWLLLCFLIYLCGLRCWF